MGYSSQASSVQVASLCQIDALVGEHVTEEVPEVTWQDSYGLFRFATKTEAEAAVRNAYYQRFRPDLDWKNAAVKEVRHFSPYSSNLIAAWKIVDRLGAESREMEIRRHGDFWRVVFSGSEGNAYTPSLAICLAALRKRGIEPVFCESLFFINVPNQLAAPN